MTLSLPIDLKKSSGQRERLGAPYNASFIQMEMVSIVSQFILWITSYFETIPMKFGDEDEN